MADPGLHCLPVHRNFQLVIYIIGISDVPVIIGIVHHKSHLIIACDRGVGDLLVSLKVRPSADHKIHDLIYWMDPMQLMYRKKNC